MPLYILRQPYPCFGQATLDVSVGDGDSEKLEEGAESKALIIFDDTHYKLCS